MMIRLENQSALTLFPVRSNCPLTSPVPYSVVPAGSYNTKSPNQSKLDDLTDLDYSEFGGYQ